MSANGLMVLEPVLTSWPGLEWDEGELSLLPPENGDVCLVSYENMP